MDSILSAELLEWLATTPSKVDADVGPSTCQLTLTDNTCSDLVNTPTSAESAHAFTEETYIDNLLQAALDSYENTASLEPSDGMVPNLFSPTHQDSTRTQLLSPSSSSSQLLGLHRRFAAPKTEAEIVQARTQGVPLKTQKDTKYCVGVWESWREYRNSTTGAAIAPLTELNHSELDHWLTRFILEVRKKDGSEFPPNSLHHICCGLMRHLRWNGQPSIDFFAHGDFAKFKASLDSELKRLQSKGTGSQKKQAEVLTEDEEDLLWNKGLLGDANPQSLLDTMVFYNGLYFALRSGQEHRQLRSNPCQIQLIERPGEKSYLKYTEDSSKNRPGGLKGRNIKPKVVIQHENTANPRRCFVRLFKRYIQLTPNTKPDHAFYLQPMHTPTSQCWYTNKPLGHHTLRNTVARLCKEAGITGYKTNHSLRATAATRLYQSGIDEQLVMERTGHRSLEGVRNYKRTSDQQREALSDILNSKRVCSDATTATSSTNPSPCTSLTPTSCSHEQPKLVLPPPSNNMQAHIQNTTSTPAAFYFSSCSSITINVNHAK